MHVSVSDDEYECQNVFLSVPECVVCVCVGTVYIMSPGGG